IIEAQNIKSDKLGTRWLNAYCLHFRHEILDEDNIEEVKFIWTREKPMD
ncbi:26326_t:CDS:1, partial [Gigaspora rosea]